MKIDGEIRMSLNQKSKVCLRLTTAIPKRVADYLHVKPGDELEYVERGGKIFIIKARK